MFNFVRHRVCVFMLRVDFTRAVFRIAAKSLLTETSRVSCNISRHEVHCSSRFRPFYLRGQTRVQEAGFVGPAELAQVSLRFEIWRKTLIKCFDRAMSIYRKFIVTIAIIFRPFFVTNVTEKRTYCKERKIRRHEMSLVIKSIKLKLKYF